MKCPLCDIALKAASHRGIVLSYCPVCGGTWLDRERFGYLGTVTAPGLRGQRRLLRLAVPAAVVLLCGMVAAAAAVGVKSWPVVSGWVRALSSGERGNAGVLQKTVAAALAAKAGYGALAGSVAAVSGLGALVESGAYLAALKEAQRQGLGNLADLKTENIAAPEVRAAAGQVQRVLAAAPGAAIAGVVDPAVIQLMESREFELVRASGLLRQLTAPGAEQGRTQVD